MIRRAVVAVALSVFAVGAFSSEATAFVRRPTDIVTLSIQQVGPSLVVEGDVRSTYRPCNRARAVGLFRNNEQVQRTKSDNKGRFTFTVPAVAGEYLIVAFKEARDGCANVCRPGRESFTFEGQLL